MAGIITAGMILAVMIFTYTYYVEMSEALI